MAVAPNYGEVICGLKLNAWALPPPVLGAVVIEVGGPPSEMGV